jgi:hypothetical protein
MDSATVDGDMWYTIAINRSVIAWLQTQEYSYHLYLYEHPSMLSYADVPSELFTLLKLKFA